MLISYFIASCFGIELISIPARETGTLHPKDYGIRKFYLSRNGIMLFPASFKESFISE
mgnify:CR=1 FL=1